MVQFMCCLGNSYISNNIVIKSISRVHGYMGNMGSQSVCDETVYILVLLQAIDSNSAKIMLQPS